VKKMAFLKQNKAKLSEILIITLVLEKNANFFAENCQKLQKIVIITSVQSEQMILAQYVAQYIFRPKILHIFLIYEK
jgi:hypothetical protein